ncbi:hypothetical protein LTS18_011374, partial [Coniosporium uncinatum]
MTIPQEFVLSLEYVEGQAKVDQNLRQLLAAIGDYGRTARGAILVFLLHQATIACPEIRDKIGVASPFTEYIKFLPEELLPTFWTEDERQLLVGTSLKAATSAKVKSLQREFDDLRAATETIGWCSKYWWDDEDGLISFDDWLQVDAMYRSRALEFPGIGDSMVPCIDMANHSSGESTIALYETDDRGNAILLLRDGKTVSTGSEITITYGDNKGACEMVFSYGFIEGSMASAKELFLELGMPEDDPLGMAKKAVSKAAPGVKLFQKEDGTTDWVSDFVWWLCVNEEDGLDFQVLQTTDGGRELKVFWKEEGLQDASKLKDLLLEDLLWDVFQLRAVATLQERVEAQLMQLHTSEEVEHADHGRGTSVRDGPWHMAMKLRQLEGELLERSYAHLEAQ